MQTTVFGEFFVTTTGHIWAIHPKKVRFGIAQTLQELSALDVMNPSSKHRSFGCGSELKACQGLTYFFSFWLTDFIKIIKGILFSHGDIPVEQHKWVNMFLASSANC